MGNHINAQGVKENEYVKAVQRWVTLVISDNIQVIASLFYAIPYCEFRPLQLPGFMGHYTYAMLYSSSRKFTKTAHVLNILELIFISFYSKIWNIHWTRHSLDNLPEKLADNFLEKAGARMGPVMRWEWSLPSCTTLPRYTFKTGTLTCSCHHNG